MSQRQQKWSYSLFVEVIYMGNPSSNYYTNEYLYIAYKVKVYQQIKCLKVLQLRYFQERRGDAGSSEICLPLRHMS